ncbi:zinc-dependent peptidase [Comamonas flocculans]|uniref:Zinc-dependent peptidase n=1 Tax=Comamonas flocculans TaxID=2597701 RepID=A0A5B8RY03_9BURK|nr:M90 family metallopeptidase [Comamonas flocculans]QEA13528.1 zinc-dependent peptidase [Comamonas flocculans]
MRRAVARLLQRLVAMVAPVRPISDALWLPTIAHYGFLRALSLQEQAKLRVLAALFLRRKEFTGAHGLEVSDAMAVAIAAQACLPLLHWGEPRQALAWYDDFVGIVVHPTEALALRSSMDAAGVVHHYHEVLLGEAMEHGPIMLVWPAVHEAGQRHSSVVIHEFMHKIDMKAGRADGCPPLPPGFMGMDSVREARRLWRRVWSAAYVDFRDRVRMAERFGEPWPWLDAYGASAPGEFFAVACEAWFVDPPRFAEEFPALVPLLKAFFQPVQPG